MKSQKIKKIGFGTMFGLALFGILSVFLMTGTAAGDDIIHSSDRAWNVSQHGSYGFDVGAKGVGVSYWRSWNENHGAHIAMATRAELDHGTGQLAWASSDSRMITRDHRTWSGVRYTWRVRQFDFRHRVVYWMTGRIHYLEYLYQVRHQRTTPWWWGEYTDDHPGRLQTIHFVSY